jgi:hypothetical protein
MFQNDPPKRNLITETRIVRWVAESESDVSHSRDASQIAALLSIVLQV